jgi:hypothetical protein
VAREAGVARLVHLSVIHSDLYVDVPHFPGKFGVERMIEQMGFNATILRPPYIMSNDSMIKVVVLGYGLYPMRGVRTVARDGKVRPDDVSDCVVGRRGSIAARRNQGTRVDRHQSEKRHCVARSEWNGHVTMPKGGRLRYVPLTRRLAENEPTIASAVLFSDLADRSLIARIADLSGSRLMEDPFLDTPPRTTADQYTER